MHLALLSAATCVAATNMNVTPTMPAGTDRTVIAPPLAAILDDTEPPASSDGFDSARIDFAEDDARWLPLIEGAARGAPIVEVRSGRHAFRALLDTGATRTLLSPAVAARIGARTLVDESGVARTSLVRDVVGREQQARVVQAPSISIGAITFTNVQALVVDGDDVDVDHNIIGWPELSRVDLVLVADSGVVGVFAGGEAPLFPGARRIPLEVRATDARVSGDVMPVEQPTRRRGLPPASAKLSFLVDTGASSSAVPPSAGVAVDKRLARSSRAVGRKLSTDAGIAHVRLGDVDLGTLTVDVLPDNSGLIGGDVLLANRTVISAQRAFIELAPSRWGSARRKTWRDRSCATRTTHCIAASLQPCGKKDTCVAVELAGAVEGRVAVDVRFFDDRGQQIDASAMTALFTPGSARRDMLALPAHLSARKPKKVTIRVRAPEKSEKCGARATCWWR